MLDFCDRLQRSHVITRGQDEELHRTLQSMSLPLPTQGVVLNFDPPEFQMPSKLLQQAALLRDGMHFLQLFSDVLCYFRTLLSLLDCFAG